MNEMSSATAAYKPAREKRSPSSSAVASAGERAHPWGERAERVSLSRPRSGRAATMPTTMGT